MTKFIFLFRSTVGFHQKFTAIFVNAIILWGLMPPATKSVSAQTILGCDNVVRDLITISNSATLSYSDRLGDNSNQITSPLKNTSADTVSEENQPLRLVSLGVEDESGNSLIGLGAISTSLSELYQAEGFNPQKANDLSLATISRWAALSADASSVEVVTAVKARAIAELEAPDKKEIIESIPDSDLLTALAGLRESHLKSLGLTDSEAEIVGQVEINPEENSSFMTQALSAIEEEASTLDRLEAQTAIKTAIARYETELANLRTGDRPAIISGSQIQFKFRLDNQQQEAATVELPDAQAITAKGLIGSGRIKGVVYRRTAEGEVVETKNITENSETVSIPPSQSVELDVTVEVGEISDTEISSLEINLQPSCGTPTFQSLSILPPLAIDPVENNDGGLIDPLGQITGCAGELLPDYQGFSIGMYDPDPTDVTGSTVREITPLTATELPNDPNNNTPKGIEPNTQNSNPFFLTNTDEGRYSFLFDEKKNQLDFGAAYILLVSPPTDSIYNERRVKLEIGDRQGNIVQYTATSLDGKSITSTDGQTTITGEIVLVEDAERVGLDLAVLDLSTSICEAQEIQITKTGDRAVAEPGDTVLYRLAVRNLSSAPINNLQISDTLPVGFRLVEDSVRGEANEESVPIVTTPNNRKIDLTTDITLDMGETVNLVYAAQLTPNAFRGSGRNSAVVNATRTDNNNSVQDGPAIHNLRIEPGIIEDTGIIIGRVFVDKNFDGEQQSGEPGIPNAVIFLEDGNRIITDPDGLFSLANVLPGNHTGILDLTSIPEYRLAPNIRFSERNSSSRLVKLEPGGMVRMNFGVTPTATGKDTESRRKIPPQPTKPTTQPRNTQPRGNQELLESDF